jgi:hypothetical protein
MNKMLLSIHQNWHVGIAEYTPSQNNGLESHNLVIRKEETFRERMPLSRFLHQSLQALEKWSMNHSYLFSTNTAFFHPSVIPR